MPRKTDARSDAALKALARELEAPLHDDFVFHGYTRLSSSIARRKWQSDAEDDSVEEAHDRPHGRPFLVLPSKP